MKTCAPSVNLMFCGFRKLPRFVKTARIHLKHATYPQLVFVLRHFASYPARYKIVSNAYNRTQNEIIYQRGFAGQRNAPIRSQIKKAGYII